MLGISNFSRKSRFNDAPPALYHYDTAKTFENIRNISVMFSTQSLIESCPEAWQVSFMQQ